MDAAYLAKSGLAGRRLVRLAVPEGIGAAARLVLLARAMRAVADGALSLLLPAYLSSLGFGAAAVGAVATATLLGSAMLTLFVGFAADRLGRGVLLLAAALLMAATGFGFAIESRFWPLMVIAFVGTLNPSGGDVSLFLPLEQSLIADSVPDRSRTAAFAAFNLVSSLGAAAGSLAAGLPELIAGTFGVGLAAVLSGAFAAYGVIGLATFALYRRLPAALPRTELREVRPLGPSRRIVFLLAGLFSIDAFAGGLLVRSLMALWLADRFGMSLAGAAALFFWSGLLSAASYPMAERIARRIGLVNTMVWTHLPANLCLILLPWAPGLAAATVLLLIRALLSQMDVPTRTSYVMAVVTPAERPAAAGVTAVPRSLAAAFGPLLAGWLLALSPVGWPFLLAGALKAAYDLMLLALCRRVRPPEER